MESLRQTSVHWTDRTPCRSNWPVSKAFHSCIGSLKTVIGRPNILVTPALKQCRCGAGCFVELEWKHISTKPTTAIPLDTSSTMVLSRGTSNLFRRQQLGNYLQPGNVEDANAMIRRLVAYIGRAV